VRYLAACGLGLAACFLLTSEVPGKFARVEVEKVPVERLVTNLEGAVKKSPKNVQALVNLARVHGMAYALKTDNRPGVEGPRGPRPLVRLRAKARALQRGGEDHRCR
jgi:hypothetical protein